jgi:uncharacterized protein YheU (UPF0270 family)
MSNQVVIPHTALSADALTGVVEEFITREGTDYGLREHSLEQKREAVMKQLQRGEVVILFDAEAEAVTLVTRQELRELQSRPSD